MSENMMWERILEALQSKGNVPNTFTRYLGKQLKKAREEAGLSQSELAEQIYRRRPSISDMENAKMMPDVGTVVLLALRLNKSVMYFIPPQYVRDINTNLQLTNREQEMLSIFRDLDEETQNIALKQMKILID